MVQRGFKTTQDVPGVKPAFGRRAAREAAGGAGGMTTWQGAGRVVAGGCGKALRKPLRNVAGKPLPGVLRKPLQKTLEKRFRMALEKPLRKGWRSYCESCRRSCCQGCWENRCESAGSPCEEAQTLSHPSAGRASKYIAASTHLKRFIVIYSNL